MKPNDGKPADSGVSASFSTTLDLGGTASSPSQEAPSSKEIGTADFVKEVIEASAQKPVLVDFWAPWCGPCKQLTPALEKAVAASNGAVTLVKMNIDEHPDIAGQMGIQSIPAVVAFVDGRPKDAFMGALPEGDIRKFINKLTGDSGPSPIETALAQAEELAQSGDASQAARLYSAVLQQDAENVAALAGMGSLYIESNDLERAKQMLDAIPAEAHKEPKPASLKAAIELAEQASELGDAAQLADRIKANPNDHDARFDLALIHNAKGDRQSAADQLLEIIRQDREWRDDGARKQLLQFFEAWGMADPASASARRKLSSILFS